MQQDQALNLEEINQFLATDRNWRFEDDRLKAEYKAESFDKAIEIINEIATVCKRMDHHPLMTNVYDRLMFSLCTHRAGDMVTALDIQLAKEISNIVNSQK